MISGEGLPVFVIRVAGCFGVEGAPGAEVWGATVAACAALVFATGAVGCASSVEEVALAVGCAASVEEVALGVAGAAVVAVGCVASTEVALGVAGVAVTGVAVADGVGWL